MLVYDGQIEQEPENLADETLFDRIALRVLELLRQGNLSFQRQEGAEGVLAAIYEGYLFISLGEGGLGILRLEKLEGRPIYNPNQPDTNIIRETGTNNYYRGHFDLDLSECLKAISKDDNVN